MTAHAVAGESDVARARAFLAAWDLAVVRRVYPDGTAIPQGSASADAVQALAQAFADERLEGYAHLEGARAALKESHATAVSLAAELSRVQNDLAGTHTAWRACRTELDARAAASARENREYIAIRDELEAARDALARAETALRLAVGVVSDLARLEPQIRAVLDGYAAGAPCGLLAPHCTCGLAAAGAGEHTAWCPSEVVCALPRGHRGPCGVTR